MALDNIDVWNGGQIPIIRFRGDFSWQGLYRLIRGWIDKKEFRFTEKKYKHKGSDVEVEMQGDRKIDAMHKYYLIVEIKIWELKDVEAIEEGKKVKTNSGRMELKISGSVEVDYSGRFSGRPLYEKLGRWWMKITMRDIENFHLDPHTYDLYGLHQEIKSFLKMETDSNAF